MEVVGQIVRGSFADIFVRQKSGSELELGELLVAENNGAKILLQVFDLLYGSQLEEQALELASGMHLEGFAEGTEFLEKNLRTYVLARVKAIAEEKNGLVRQPKKMPAFFENLRLAEARDLKLDQGELFLGKVRSGSKVLEAVVKLPAREVLSHHVLVAASTGKGKSNAIKTMLWSLLDSQDAGFIVLDSHDEYYGRTTRGLKNHENAGKKLVYYTPSVTPNAVTLKISLRCVKPWHFKGVVSFTEAQEQAAYVYYQKHGSEWLKKLFEAQCDGRDYLDGGISAKTLPALQRKLGFVLGVSYENGELKNKSVFATGEKAGETTVADVAKYVSEAKTIIIDTSTLSNEAELLVGSVFAHALLEKNKELKKKGEEFERAPVSCVVLEEAPRVLNEVVGANVFSTIAREGRKFKVGLIAVTQLASVIPKEILANLCTKIILGNEMSSERDALIANAAQDLSKDAKAIAALDKGEAIVSSAFAKYAVPIQVPLFEELAEENASPPRAGVTERKKFV